MTLEALDPGLRRGDGKGCERRALLAVAALALTAAAPAPPPVAHPALWRVADADTTIYLFGTFHALPAGYAWQDAGLTAAFARADSLTIETIVGNAQEMGGLMMELGTAAAPLPRLLDRVPAERREQLAKLAARTPMPLARLDQLETWAAALILAQPMMNDLGLAAGNGVEERLTEAFAERGRPVTGLETVREQLGFLDKLPEADQRTMLEGMLEQSEELRDAFAAMLAAWARGDEDAIAATFDKELKGSPTLRQVLLAGRNAAWAGAVARMLDRPGTILVAVGAGHLAGGDSLQKMLERRGLKVTRVR